MKKVYGILFILSMIILLNSCVYTVILTPQKTFSEKFDDETVKDSVLTANIGNYIYFFNKIENIWNYCYVTEGDIDIPKVNFSSWNGISLDNKISKTVVKGTRFCENYETRINNHWAFSSIEEGVVLNQVGKIPTYFVIKDDFAIAYQLSTQKMRVSGNLTKFTYTFTTPIRVKKVKSFTSDNVIYSVELIYSGIQNNNIVLNYKEYYKNNARPAFYQTLYYNLTDIKNDNIIVFKDLKFEIIEFNNQFIKYKVLN